MKKRRKSLIFRATMSVAALMLLACASFAICIHSAHATQNVEGPYVVYDAVNESLTFNYGTYTEGAYTKGISDIQYTSATLNNRPWAAWVTNVIDVGATSAFRKNFNPHHLSYWFYGMTSLKGVSFSNRHDYYYGVTYWKNVDDMTGIFEGCTALRHVFIDTIDCAPTNMTDAFKGCSQISSLSLSPSFRFQLDADFIWAGSAGMYWASQEFDSTDVKTGSSCDEWNNCLATFDSQYWGFDQIRMLSFALCNSQICFDANKGSAFDPTAGFLQKASFFGIAGEEFNSGNVGNVLLVGRLGYSFCWWGTDSAEGSPEVVLPQTFPVTPVTTYYAQWVRGGLYCTLTKNGLLTYAYGNDLTPQDNVWPVYAPVGYPNDLSSFSPYVLTVSPVLRKNIKAVSFDSSLVQDKQHMATIAQLAYFFGGQFDPDITSQLQHVLGLQYFPIKGEEGKEGELIPMGMFANCTQLKTIDMSGWDIEFINGEAGDVGNYYWMFKGASSLRTLDMRDVYSSYTSAQPDETRSPLFDGCDNLNELIMSDTAGFALQFPVSDEWSAYYNGALQAGANLTTQEGVNAYFQNHPGVTYFVKQGKEATTSFVANGGTFADSGMAYDQTQTIGANSITLPEAPTRPGYYFWGWADTEDAQRRTLDPNNLPNLVDAKTTYYAVWGTTPAPPDPEPTPTDTVTITFRTEEGSWAGITETTREGASDAAIIAPVYPTVDASRTCIGWFDEAGKEIISGVTKFSEVTGVVTARFVDTPGWHQSATGWWYVYDFSNNYYTNCWALINSAWFYFNDAGYCLEYTWGYINGAWYFFGWGGYMQTGWQWISSSWYFLDRYTGAMKCGWVHDGVWYYCDAALGGAMYDNCWAYINGNWYGFNEGGSMTQGWSYSYAYDGWFYLEPETGHMLYSWQYIGGHWYYFYDNGLMAANTYVGNYWLGSDGAMW